MIISLSSFSCDDRSLFNVWFFSFFLNFVDKFLRMSFFLDELDFFMIFESSSASFELVILFNKVCRLNRSAWIEFFLTMISFSSITSFSLISCEKFMKFASLIIAAIFMKSWSLIFAAIFMKFIDRSLSAATFEATFSILSALTMLFVICESLSMKFKLIEFRCTIRTRVMNSSFDDE